MEEYSEKNFNNKVNNCFSCKSVNIEKVADITSNQYYWYDHNIYSVYECKICNLLFVNPMPTNSFLDAHYNLAFDHSTAIRPQRAKDIDYTIKLILSMIDKGKEHNQINYYEIGIGEGEFIKRIAQVGVHAKGNDLSKNMTGKRFPFPIDNGRFEDFGYDNCFDIVYTSHVLEHSNNPSRFTGAIYKSLKYGGIAVIRVPNRNGTYHWLAKTILGPYKWVTLMPVPDHLTMFDKNNFKMFLENNGFKVEKVLTLPTMANQTILTLSYLSVLSRFIILRIMPLLGIKLEPSSLITNKNGKPTIVRKIFDLMRQVLGPIDKIWIWLTWPIFDRYDLGDELFVIARK